MLTGSAAELADNGGASEPVKAVAVTGYDVTRALEKLSEDERSYVKMILRFDDDTAQIFFARQALIVEGDTEEIVLRETFRRMPPRVRNLILYNWQVVKARGKAAIIPLVHYFKLLDVPVHVVHDSDTSVEGAAVYNEPIRQAVDDDSRITRLDECLEDVLGYEVPRSEKPSTAYRHTTNWGDGWDRVPDSWRQIMESIFAEEFSMEQQLRS